MAEQFLTTVDGVEHSAAAIVSMCCAFQSTVPRYISAISPLYPPYISMCCAFQSTVRTVTPTLTPTLNTRPYPETRNRKPEALTLSLTLNPSPHPNPR